jgi:hypothetical protein
LSPAKKKAKQWAGHQAVRRFLQARARFLAGQLPEMLRAVWPQRELDFSAGEDHE